MSNPLGAFFGKINPASVKFWWANFNAPVGKTAGQLLQCKIFLSHFLLTLTATLLNGNFLLILFMLPLFVLVSAWAGRYVLWVYFFSTVEALLGGLFTLPFFMCVFFCIFFFWRSLRRGAVYPYSLLVGVVAIWTVVLSTGRAVFGGLSGLTAFVPASAPASFGDSWGAAGYCLAGSLSLETGVLALVFIFVLFLLFRVVRLGLLLDTRRFFLQNKVIDLFVLVVLAVTFAALLVAADNFLFLFLVWVGLNLSIYGLLAQFSFSLKAQEAAMKYFILGLLAAGFFLFGVWLLFVTFGSTGMGVIASYTACAAVVSESVPALAVWAVCLVVSVLLFKLSAVPFHAWAPDVYEGASWFAVAILVLLVKPVFVVLLIKVLLGFGAFKVLLAPVVFFSGLLSLVVGTLGAAFQQKIKRFLALSSISHMGFILMLLGLDFSNVTLVLNYLLAYVVANFILIATISHMRISGPLYPTSRSLVYVSELAFLNGTAIFRSPRTLVLSVALFSLAGLPPFLGFFAKLGFFLACASKLTVLSAVGFGFAFLLMPISVFNYIRIVRVLWVGDCSAYRGVFFVNLLSDYWYNLVVASAMFGLVFGGLFIFF